MHRDSSSQSLRSTGQGLEEWIVLDKSLSRSRSQTFHKWVANDDRYDLNGAAHFVSLLRNMLAGRSIAQEFFLEAKGVQIMGLLLQRCDPRLINVGFLMSVQSLVESLLGGKDKLLKAFYQYVLFEFRIWSDSDISLRIAHVQLVSTYIKDNSDYFRKFFGIEHFLCVIRSHYSGSIGRRRRENTIRLTEEDEKSMRMALLGKFA